MLCFTPTHASKRLSSTPTQTLVPFPRDTHRASKSSANSPSESTCKLAASADYVLP